MYELAENKNQIKFDGTNLSHVVLTRRFSKGIGAFSFLTHIKVVMSS